MLGGQGLTVQAHGRLEEDKRKFEVSLGYILRPWLKKEEKKKKEVGGIPGIRGDAQMWLTGRDMAEPGNCGLQGHGTGALVCRREQP